MASFKLTKWSPSFRTKVIFFALVCVVLLGFCLTLATLYAVEARKRQIVGAARELVQSRADELSKRLAKFLEEEKTGDLATLLKSERFQHAVPFMVTRQLVYYLYDRNGHVVDIIYSEVAKDLGVEATTAAISAIAEARRPILQGGEPRGDVGVVYVPEVLLNQINKESRQITLWLLALATVLSVLMAATFLLLWHVFRRQIERERAHEKLDRMAQIGTLASGLAHEIRNPLNAFSLNLDIIGEEIADPQLDSTKRTRTILELLKSEIRRLNSTLTNFLQYALPASGRMQMTDVVALWQETATLLEPDMRQRRVHYRFEGERSCATLADSTALRQVFWNVLLNAVQALEGCEERRIVASCRVESGECQFEIRDTGPGVPAEHREKVFEVFHSTRPGGSGFGLAIARQIVTRHGGSIWIDSRDGWGCVVHIRLPLRTGDRPSKQERTRA